MPRWRSRVRVSSTAPANVRRLAADVFCCAHTPLRFKTLRSSPILLPAAALFPMPVRKLYTISVSGMPPCQGGGRKSESRLPLQPVSVALRRTFFVVLAPRRASKRRALPLYPRQPLPCFQCRWENCIPSQFLECHLAKVEVASPSLVYRSSQCPSPCGGRFLLCSCPAALQNAALFPYTPASRCHVSNTGGKTAYHRKSLSSNKSSIALGTPPCAYSHRTVCRAIASRTPALGLRWPLRRIARFCLANTFLHRRLQPPATAYQALAALYSRCPRPPSGRYSPHKSLHAIHTAIPLAKAQITLHLPSFLKHPSAPLSPASGNRPSGPRRSVFPLPATSVWPVFSA